MFGWGQSPIPIKTLKNPQHFSKRVGESTRCWSLGISDALITRVPADDEDLYGSPPDFAKLDKSITFSTKLVLTTIFGENQS